MCVWLFVLGAALAGPAAYGQSPTPVPQDVRALTDLLRKPEIQAWLQAETEGTEPAQTQADDLEAGPMTGEMAMQESVASYVDGTRAFVRELVAEAPELPDELEALGMTVSQEFSRRGLSEIVLLLAVFALVGFGVEWLFWWSTGRFRAWMIASPMGTVRERMRAIGLRTVYGLGVLLAFTLGSVGTFVAFDWPPLLRRIVLSYLLVVLIVRLCLVLGRIILAPGAERFRMLPMATVTARFWFVWTAVLIGWFFAVQITLELLGNLGMSRPSIFLVGAGCGVVLLAMGLWIVWRRPDAAGVRASRERRLGAIGLSAYLVTVWLLLFTGSVTPFYVGVILLILPIVVRCIHAGVGHLLRPAGETHDEVIPSLAIVSLERGLRAAVLIGATLLLANVVGLDLIELGSGDTMEMRLLRGAFNAAIIILLADFGWQLAKAWIDGQLIDADAGTDDADEARRRARLRTLLPILRNVLMVVLAVMTGLMVLSSLGIEVAPLIAGAGVVGIAIGFGAQTLVKDIISGMFFLLDDAFRVGEYIESGDIRGTVESFSLRSMKIRHHRGALHTIPFGALDKITNYSRDWVIDKMTVNVPFDTDLALVKRIVKQVGKELAADEEFKPHIIEPLKMQGVDQFSDFAMEIRMKMMTKPGEQFVIRRRAYAMIKQAFKENGIDFAVPTVTVAGGDAGPAAAQKAIEMTRPPVPAS
ncbi:mechanosensitive ion channel family protein [Marinivivus vitaminiproducens]|uniref:mechanosensitive ion channel family protein n=1 Tax=Marinivivus vitaminiproducens TaxID=3035935 RepID=UPI0027A65D89|nr:mechanosensitive ion channel family protein [Geminicoccaceae bacterium SCSIO 64248]